MIYRDEKVCPFPFVIWEWPLEWQWVYLIAILVILGVIMLFFFTSIISSGNISDKIKRVCACILPDEESRVSSVKSENSNEPVNGLRMIGLMDSMGNEKEATPFNEVSMVQINGAETTAKTDVQSQLSQFPELNRKVTKQAAPDLRHIEGVISEPALASSSKAEEALKGEDNEAAQA